MNRTYAPAGSPPGTSARVPLRSRVRTSRRRPLSPGQGKRVSDPVICYSRHGGPRGTACLAARRNVRGGSEGLRWPPERGTSKEVTIRLTRSSYVYRDRNTTRPRAVRPAWLVSAASAPTRIAKASRRPTPGNPPDCRRTRPPLPAELTTQPGLRPKRSIRRTFSAAVSERWSTGKAAKPRFRPRRTLPTDEVHRE